MRKAAIFLSLLLLGSLSGFAGTVRQQRELKITLRNVAVSEGRFVQLSEIAVVSGAGNELAGKVMLGRTPRAGDKSIVDRLDVARRMVEEGFQESKLLIDGATEVVISPADPDPEAARKPGKPSSGDQDNHHNRISSSRHEQKALRNLFASWVRKSLSERISCDPDRLIVRAIGRVRGELPKGDIEGISHSIKWPVGALKLGRQRLTAELYRGDQRLGQVEGYFETAAKLNVLVANRSIDKGQQVSAKDFNESELVLTDLAARYVLDPKVLDGLCAAQPIRAGKPLQPEMIKKTPVVLRNQPVTVVSEYGSVRITLAGVAKAEGGIGDMIPVERSGHNGTMMCRIAGNGIVKVD